MFNRPFSFFYDERDQQPKLKVLIFHYIPLPSMKALCLLVFIFLLAVTSTFSQAAFSKTYQPGKKLYAQALQGLSLRADTNLKAKVLTVVPFGDVVEVMADSKPKVAITNSNISGTWVKVKYGINTGYMFDGFLSRLKPMDKTENYTYELADYLKGIFKAVSDVKKPGNDNDETRKVVFANGIVSEYKVEEMRVTNTISFPVNVITFQEMYLLARQAHEIFFYNGCAYKADDMSCDYEEIATLTLKKKGNFYVMEFVSAD